MPVHSGSASWDDSGRTFLNIVTVTPEGTALGYNSTTTPSPLPSRLYSPPSLSPLLPASTPPSPPSLPLSFHACLFYLPLLHSLSPSHIDVRSCEGMHEHCLWLETASYNSNVWRNIYWSKHSPSTPTPTPRCPLTFSRFFFLWNKNVCLIDAYNKQWTRRTERVWTSGRTLHAGKQKDLGSIRFGSAFLSKIMVYGQCLETLPTQLMKHENVSYWWCPPYCRVILVVDSVASRW